MSKKINVDGQQYELMVKICDWYKMNHDTNNHDITSTTYKNISERLTNREYDKGFELNENLICGLKIMAEYFIDCSKNVETFLDFLNKGSAK